MNRFIAILFFCLCPFLPARAGQAGPEAVRALLAEDRWKEALTLAREQPDLQEGEERAALGEALFRAGELEEAASVLSSVLEQCDPPPVRALVQLGLLRLAEGRDLQGAKLLRKALEMSPDDPYVLFRAAGAAGSRERVIETLKRYIEKVGESEPDRVEGAEGTIRFLTGLGDRETWIQESRPARVVVPLRMVPGAAGRIRGYTLKATVGERNKPVRILLDTGSTGFYLDQRVALKHGMEAIAEETVFGGGGSGRHRTGRGILSRLETGAVTFRDVLALASSTRLDPAASFRGLIGLDPFLGYIITLDLAGGSMLLESPPSSGDPWPGEGWTDGARYWTVSGQMLVEVEDAGGAHGLFVLDSGADRSLVSENFADRVEGAEVRSETMVRGYGGVRANSRQVHGVDLRFQGLTGNNRSLVVTDLELRSRLSGVEISGFIGLDMIAGEVIRIDTLARQVFVKKKADSR